MKLQRLKTAPAQLGVLLLAGCSSSPAQNLFGSFFPAWMLCASAGIVTAIVLGKVLSVIGVGPHLIAPPLTYSCIAVASTLLVWLLWFGH